LSDHANVVSDRVDLGHRIFLAGFFTAFAIGPALAIVGYGMTKNPLIAWAALVNGLLMMAAAHYLYAGRKMERVVWLVGAVFLALAVIAVVKGQGPAGYYLAAVLLMPVLFAGIVATPAVRSFLGYQRGEAPPPELPARPVESFLEARADGLALREDAKAPALNYARALRLAAGLLLLCVAGGIVLAVRSLLLNGTGWAMIVLAILAVPSALALLTLADDWRYLATTKGYEKGHLANIVKDSQLLRSFVGVSIAIVALLAIMDVAMR
jgi:hypothetical protein